MDLVRPSWKIEHFFFDFSSAPRRRVPRVLGLPSLSQSTGCQGRLLTLHTRTFHTEWKTTTTTKEEEEGGRDVHRKPMGWLPDPNSLKKKARKRIREREKKRWRTERTKREAWLLRLWWKAVSWQFIPLAFQTYHKGEWKPQSPFSTLRSTDCDIFRHKSWGARKRENNNSGRSIYTKLSSPLISSYYSITNSNSSFKQIIKSRPNRMRQNVHLHTHTHRTIERRHNRCVCPSFLPPQLITPLEKITIDG